MNDITKMVIEFLTDERNCTLVTNEVSKRDVFAIAEREGVEIINKEGKIIETSFATKGKYHYIKY